jgi:argininosuccinate lyase
MTHLQHAQPVSLGHHLLAYFWMFNRDVQRLQESLRRISSLPLGSAALAGTGFPIDREQVRKELNFMQISENSLDAVSDRDFVIEFLSNASLIMTHLSRFSEELIIWSTPEFGFVELGDEVTTGSSIMPQKKNPDVAELIRGRVGRLYGALIGSLTMMKGLPLAYNRDMQEDKVHLFEGLETVTSCVNLMTLMLQKATWKTEKMQAALKADFSNATDLADDLVVKGLTFREAHEVVGRLVQTCLKAKKGLEDLTLKELKAAHPLYDETSLAKIPHLAVLKARTSAGGTSPAAVGVQIEQARAAVKSLSAKLNHSN